MSDTPEVKPTSLAEYQPGKWFHANSIEEMKSFYLSRLPAIREAARHLGYAIGQHGSERRDFDLMAMPWRVDSASPEELARAIHKAACGFANSKYEWGTKPAGRKATCFPVCWVNHEVAGDKLSIGHIDLSVIYDNHNSVLSTDLTFAEFLHANRLRQKDWPSENWSLAQWITALTGEIGEAANIVKKTFRGDLTLDEAREDLGRELADVLTYLVILADKAGIDLSRAAIIKFNEKSRQVGSNVFIATYPVTDDDNAVREDT